MDSLPDYHNLFASPESERPRGLIASIAVSGVAIVIGFGVWLVIHLKNGDAMRWSPIVRTWLFVCGPLFLAAVGITVRTSLRPFIWGTENYRAMAWTLIGLQAVFWVALVLWFMFQDPSQAAARPMSGQ